MPARFVLIAAATLVSSTAFAAEPQKPAPQPARGDAAPAQIVLASAENIRTPASAEQQAPAEPKRRISRVTSCRCGDPQPEQQQQQ